MPDGNDAKFVSGFSHVGQHRGERGKEAGLYVTEVSLQPQLSPKLLTVLSSSMSRHVLFFVCVCDLLTSRVEL